MVEYVIRVGYRGGYSVLRDTNTKADKPDKAILASNGTNSSQGNCRAG